MDFMRGLDRGIYYWLAAHPCPRLQPVVLDLNALGGPAFLTLIIGFALVILVALSRRQTAGFLLAAVLAGLAVAHTIQLLVGREAPDTTTIEWLNARPGPQGFPTGDTLSASLAFLTLALIIAPLVTSRRVRALVVGIAVLLALLSGLTRLYLGTQLLSDVLFGWIGGCLWALISREVYARWLAP